MTDEALRELLRRAPYWVEATVASTGAPQAAVIGVVISDAFEIFFDTEVTSRKVANLARDPRVALVMWDAAVTVQLEGVADQPAGSDLQRLKSLYFQRFPEGRDRETWPTIAYIRVRPTWLRVSDFSAKETRIHERKLG